MFKRNRTLSRNNNYKRYKNNRLKRFIKSQFSKLIIAVIILVILFMLKLINIKLTNNAIQIIHKSINYEFSIVKTGEKLKTHGTKIFDLSEKIISVFTGEENFVEFQAPIEGAIYKPFGELKVSDEKTVFNNGIDIIPEKGEREVLAVADGNVVQIEDKDALGFYVVMEHEDLKFVFGHLQKVYMEKGKVVKQGEKIGTLGEDKNGNKYLHFEVWKDNKPINPEKVINMNTKYN